MEALQPFLIALLALSCAVIASLVARAVRERRRRARDWQAIEAATPLMLARLAAIRGGPAAVEETPSDVRATVPGASAEALPGVAPALDRPAVAAVVTTPEAVPSGAVVVAPRPAPDLPQVMASRRRVWRDASAALVVFACIGLVVVLAVPAVGRPTPTPPGTAVAAVTTSPPTATIEVTLPAVALASIPLPPRVEVALPTEAPTPTLPVTQTARPTDRVAIVHATPRPTPRRTPKPTPKPTPIPPPVAKFTCSFQPPMTVAVDSTSKYAKKSRWDFGDGTPTVSGAHPSPHTYSDSGLYPVKLTVTNASGIDTKTRWVDVDAGTCT